MWTCSWPGKGNTEDVATKDILKWSVYSVPLKLHFEDMLWGIIGADIKSYCKGVHIASQLIYYYYNNFSWLLLLLRSLLSRISVKQT